jgi:hypothetical protein
VKGATNSTGSGLLGQIPFIDRPAEMRAFSNACIQVAEAAQGDPDAH